jgi:CheY-like chemotaxis protein
VSQSTPRPIPRQKILILDRQRDNLAGLRRTLAVLDAELAEADSADQALAMASADPPALALVAATAAHEAEWQLPRLLRGDANARDVPVILLVASDEQIARGYQGGVVDVLVTPLRPDALLAKVRVFLALNRRIAELTAQVRRLQAAAAPVAAAEPPEPREQVVDPTAADRQGGPLAGMAILAAEDDPFNRMVLEDMLKRAGAEPQMAENGLQALNTLRGTGFRSWDIVLCDVQMPVMDGHELARRLAELAPGLPVVGVTAHSRADERQACSDSGMLAHLAKPVRFDALVATVLAHARRRGRNAVPISADADGPQTGEMTEQQLAVLDWQGLLAHYQGRRSFVEKLLHSVLEGQSETPARLRAAVSGRDLPTIVYLGHRFAGVAGNLQATRLYAFAREVEQRATAGDPTVWGYAERLAGAIERHLQRLRERLQTAAEEPD